MSHDNNTTTKSIQSRLAALGEELDRTNDWVTRASEAVDIMDQKHLVVIEEKQDEMKQQLENIEKAIKNIREALDEEEDRKYGQYDD